MKWVQDVGQLAKQHGRALADFRCRRIGDADVRSADTNIPPRPTPHAPRPTVMSPNDLRTRRTRAARRCAETSGDGPTPSELDRRGRALHPTGQA
jgi:hypothetical protein